MATIVDESQAIRLPWVSDIDAFLEWVESDDLPEKFKPWFLEGEVWVDMSKEQLDSHLDVKCEITSVLHLLVRADGSGRIYPDGVLFTNRRAEISGNPDMVYVTNRTIEAGQVRRQPAKEGGYIGLIGSPDMVLEVVSKSSVKKDTEILFEAYWEAGIGEYWLVDARSDAIAFDIYKRGPKGFVATRKQTGWLKSAAFGKAFKLTRENDEQGNPEFTLHVK